ncbi:NUDIX hydrolase [Arenibaculum sp.]|uniref:NUDIX hydrolase n=1 Tax=Arenibaculum sp. TaxID=2865862 RepID=UPI002E0F069B|nr:hypothetical protein [Arenibaculum sp.]
MTRAATGGIALDLTAVVVAVTGETPRVLVVRDGDPPAADAPAPHRDALPSGPFDPVRHRTLQSGLRGWVEAQTGLALRYVEQLYTFGDRFRGPGELAGGPRLVSVGYLALVRETPPTAGGAEWRDWYDYLPWEDWRDDRPAILDRVVVPALRRWIERAERPMLRDDRMERAATAFGLDGPDWDGERVLERYELLYEAGLVVEAQRDRDAADAAGFGAELPPAPGEPPRALGRPMAADNRRILATALSRLRGKLKYRPLVFELLAPEFTLLRLQQLVEALSGDRLHKQNFRRLVVAGGLVEPTGRIESRTGGRPAELFRFRREAVRERAGAGAGAGAGEEA